MMTSHLARLFQGSQPIWPRARRNPIIGLDLGSKALTFVELGKRQGHYHVRRWGFQSIEPHIMEQGRIKKRSALVQAISSFVEQYRLRGASVAMAVNGASVMVKRIQGPRGDQQDLEEYVMWESAQYIPYDPDDVYLDYSLCSSASSVSTREGLDLLLVAAKRESVDERREVLEEVNLHPIVCDVEALAILNMVAMNREVQAQSSYLMANIQGDMMNVAVVVQGEPLLVRDVSFTAASRQTLTYGGFDNIGRSEWSDGTQALQDKGCSLSEKMSWFELISELKRTVEGAGEVQLDLNIERVFLCGRLGSSFELQEKIRQSLMIPVSFIDPLASFGFGDGETSVPPVDSFASVAGGLALRMQHG